MLYRPFEIVVGCLIISFIEATIRFTQNIRRFDGITIQIIQTGERMRQILSTGVTMGTSTRRSYVRELFLIIRHAEHCQVHIGHGNVITGERFLFRIVQNAHRIGGCL